MKVFLLKICVRSLKFSKIKEKTPLDIQFKKTGKLCLSLPKKVCCLKITLVLKVLNKIFFLPILNCLLQIVDLILTIN